MSNGNNKSMCTIIEYNSSAHACIQPLMLLPRVHLFYNNYPYHLVKTMGEKYNNNYCGFVTLSAVSYMSTSTIFDYLTA